jgi:hypothetical protein
MALKTKKICVQWRSNYLEISQKNYAIECRIMDKFVFLDLMKTLRGIISWFVKQMNIWYRDSETTDALNFPLLVQIPASCHVVIREE